MKEAILSHLNKHPQQRFNARQLARFLNLASGDHKNLRQVLKELVKVGKIVLYTGDRYGYRDTNKVLKGVIKINEAGYGFVIPESIKKADVFIPARYINDAWHGDTVMVESYRGLSEGRYEGRVIRVLNRAQSLIMGQVERKGKKFFVLSKDPGVPTEIYIPQKGIHKSVVGQLVVVKIIQYPAPGIIAIGDVINVLDDRCSEESFIHASLLKREIIKDFPRNIYKELERLPHEVKISGQDKRVDLTHLPMMTIDGVTARDFDDAVCLVKKGLVSILYVCIADVSEYVRKDSTLDEEAYRRATSVYLPHECIPMLPEKLSQDLCSLNPYEPRHTLTAEIHYDSNAQMQNCYFYQSMIQSKKRATYEEVQAFFDGTDQANFEPDLQKSLLNMQKLANALLRQTAARGAIGFDFPEAEIIYDEHGKIKTIQRSLRFFSHKLIEEFMIAANKAVAQYCSLHGVPLLYRVHAKPNQIKISYFCDMVRRLDLKKTGKVFDPAHFFASVKGHRLELFLQSFFLRSLKQAVYDADNIGHYGLLLKDYCHFTSPIRRYPDLIVHRQLKSLMNQNEDGILKLTRSDLESDTHFEPQKASYYYEQLKSMGEHCSRRERDSDEAEREVVAIKQTSFIKNFIHEKFFGRISRITKYGMSVELDPYFVEGWLPLVNLRNDYYIFDETKIRIVGRKTKETYCIGDRIWVIVLDAKIEKSEIILDYLQTKKKISTGHKRRNK